MSLLEQLQTEFQFIYASVNESILVRCSELCLTHNIKPEDFVDQWLAYATTKNLKEPTLDVLDRLERDVLRKQQKSSIHVPTIEPEEHNLTHTKETVTQREIESSSAEQQIFIPKNNYDNRADAGIVVQTFGSSDSNTFKQRSADVLAVVVNKDLLETKYMYETFLTRQSALSTMSRWIIKDIIDFNKLEITQERLREYSGEITICGRICCESPGKLDLNSVIFEGLLDLYSGERVKLGLSQIDKVRLFSGQSMVLTGNKLKDWFTVKQIHTGSPLVQPPLDLKDTLQIIVAAGPFTLLENLNYEPLEQLLDIVVNTKPNVLVLIGPFLDRDHPKLETMSESFPVFFEKIIEGVMQKLQNSGVKVVLVPSHRDVHNHVIFPTLPYKLKKTYKDLILAASPFTLDINGFVLSGSSADVLFHLMKVEASKGDFSDRVGQVAGHVIKQRSFYPLYPPDSDVLVDYSLVEHNAMIEALPHVMILPSNLKHFVKNIDECLIINPERLVKLNSGGTYTRLEVRSSPGRSSERVSCAIQRI